MFSLLRRTSHYLRLNHILPSAMVFAMVFNYLQSLEYIRCSRNTKNIKNFFFSIINYQITFHSSNPILSNSPCVFLFPLSYSDARFFLNDRYWKKQQANNNEKRINILMLSWHYKCFYSNIFVGCNWTTMCIFFTI